LGALLREEAAGKSPTEEGARDDVVT